MASALLASCSREEMRQRRGQRGGLSYVAGGPEELSSPQSGSGTNLCLCICLRVSVCEFVSVYVPMCVCTCLCVPVYAPVYASVWASGRGMLVKGGAVRPPWEGGESGQNSFRSWASAEAQELFQDVWAGV